MLLRALIFSLLLSVQASMAAGGEPRILKVLPQLLDAKGRNALSPSLFERDAYQLYLRQNLHEVSSLRFDVQFKTDVKGPHTVRIEIRGSKMDIGRSRIFETDVAARRWGSTWAKLHLNRAVSDEIGSILAWRASLWRDGQEIAELESFLW